ALRAGGVPVVPALRLAPGAAVPADFTGFPAVLKAEGRGLAHRSERGAVVLGLPDRAAVEGAMASLASRLGADLEAFQLQSQIPAGPELLAGFTRDPAFGTVILLGRGGVEAEADPDVAVRLWPCSRDEVAGMLDELRGKRRFLGFRGQPAVAREALVELLCALGVAADAHPDWRSVDLNPLIVQADGRLVAVDHLVIAGEPAVESAPLEPVAARAARVAPFFRARSIAVVGASNTPGKAGFVILQNLARLGFAGSIFPVNPRQAEVLGRPCHPSLAAIGQPVELVVAAIPREACLELVEDCHAAGVGHLIVSTAGFSDQGPEGRELEQRLVARCRALGIQLMGPNSIGTIEVETGLITSLASVEPVPRGGAAFLGQTGLFASCFPRWLAATGRQGALRFASIGNKAGVDEADLLGFLAEDAATRCVGLYVEGVRDGRRLHRALAETAARKPVVVLKSGRTALGRQAAASHTGALAADDRVADAALRQAGCVRVESFEELFDQARAFDVLPLPRGPRLGVVSITGVGCVLTADAVGRCGLELPVLSADTLACIREVAPDWAPIANPVDMWSTIERVGAAEAYRVLCEAVIRDEGVDALLIIHITIPESTLDAAATFGRLRALAPGKPVLGAMFGDEPLTVPIREGMEVLGIPVFADPGRAVRVLAGMVRYGAWRRAGVSGCQGL
ncbi:MAG: acetate--CoA ligase family protein, partial [Pseudomonadota bacterium]